MTQKQQQKCSNNNNIVIMRHHSSLSVSLIASLVCVCVCLPSTSANVDFYLGHDLKTDKTRHFI